jgi:hypothetical protein
MATDLLAREIMVAEMSADFQDRLLSVGVDPIAAPASAAPIAASAICWA